MTYAMLLISALSVGRSQFQQQSGDYSRRFMHVRNEFHFAVDGPYRAVAPLFGADAERAWGGPDWKPVFIHPQPAADVAGAVFTRDHGSHKSVWINTAFDLKNGHVQYVYIMDDLLITLIDIRIEELAKNRTGVSVAYERTALRIEVNDHVKELGESDARMGSEWASAINSYLTRSQQ